MQMVTKNILGYQVACQRIDKCVDLIGAWLISGEKGKTFVCANPHSFMVARRDHLFSRALKKADLLTPDGIGILIASRILGGGIKKRITGSDIFRELNSILNELGGFRYFFLGSTRQNLDLIRKKMREEFPRIEIAGMYSPPFRNDFSVEENSIMVEEINRATPDVLWVGITAPKQEKWIYQNRDELNVNFIGAVGAVFDFYAGTVKRSHPWFLAHGMEWLPRLIQEPKRLWNRTLISAPKFFMHVFMQRLGSLHR